METINNNFLFRTLIRKGKDHMVQCQDALYTYQNNDFIVAAVFDGCSSTEDSQFASNLFAKTLRRSVNKSLKIQLRNNLTDIPDLNGFVSSVLSEFLEIIIKLKSELDLNLSDLDSTAMFMFYSKHNKQGVIYSFGDGFIRINNEEPIIINQDNHPHYLTVFWKELTSDIFVLQDFLNNCCEKFTFSNLQNLVISTDGIMTFKNSKVEDADDKIAISALLNETRPNWIDKDIMLAKIHTVLERIEGWQHKDDLGIVLIMNNENIITKN